LVELKNSIVTNGFISVERIAVRPYRQVDGLYVVIDVFPARASRANVM